MQTRTVQNTSRCKSCWKRSLDTSQLAHNESVFNSQCLTLIVLGGFTLDHALYSY